MRFEAMCGNSKFVLEVSEFPHNPCITRTEADGTVMKFWFPSALLHEYFVHVFTQKIAGAIRRFL